MQYNVIYPLLQAGHSNKNTIPRPGEAFAWNAICHHRPGNTENCIFISALFIVGLE